MKDAILQMQMIALDRKGTALTVVFCDPNAMLEDGNQDDGSGLQQFRGQAKKGIRADFAARDAFKNVHNDSTILLPGKKGEMYDVEFMPQASNIQDFIAAAQFCNQSILRGLLLPSLIFGNGDGTGSYSLGQEHAKTFDKICDSVNSGLENVLLQQLVKPIIAYNFPRSAWEKDGLGSFSKRNLSQEEIEKEMAMYESGINAGVIDANDLNDLNKMRDTLGFDPRDEIIEKPMPTMPGEEGAETTEQDPAEKPEAKDAKKEDKMKRLFSKIKSIILGG
jgi:hypothetical protein